MGTLFFPAWILEPHIPTLFCSGYGVSLWSPPFSFSPFQLCPHLLALKVLLSRKNQEKLRKEKDSEKGKGRHIEREGVGVAKKKISLLFKHCLIP